MKNTFLNIPEIEKNVREKHSQFMEDFGSLTNKVEADHHLAVAKVAAKITRILTCFSDNKVIDHVIVDRGGVYPKITVSKKGYNNHVVILIDSDSVLVHRTSIHQIANIFEADREVYTAYGVDTEGFDWTDFSSKLLEYIHNKVYSRKSVAETKINSIFNNED